MQNEFIDQYVRRGLETGLAAQTTDAIGGYQVPQDIDTKISDMLRSLSAMRGVANVVRVGSAGYRKLVTAGAGGWIDDERIAPAAPAYTEIVPASGELYANPAASQQMLDEIEELRACLERIKETARLFPEAFDTLTRQEMRDAKGNWRSLIDQQTAALAKIDAPTRESEHERP